MYRSNGWRLRERCMLPAWAVKGGTVKTILAGWELMHFPDTDAKLLMVGTAKYSVAAITDYPDSVEIRAFNGDSGEFVTVRDKDHDRTYEEIEGLKDGTILKLDGGSYKLIKAENGWSLDRTP